MERLHCCYYDAFAVGEMQTKPKVIGIPRTTYDEKRGKDAVLQYVHQKLFYDVAWPTVQEIQESVVDVMKTATVFIRDKDSFMFERGHYISSDNNDVMLEHFYDNTFRNNLFNMLSSTDQLACHVASQIQMSNRRKLFEDDRNRNRREEGVSNVVQEHVSIAETPSPGKKARVEASDGSEEEDSNQESSYASGSEEASEQDVSEQDTTVKHCKRNSPV